jgi:hypothetical protein
VHVKFTDEDIRRQAVRLGLIDEGAPVPNHLRSRVVATLIQDARDDELREQPEPRLAREIVIQSGGTILIDGEPFPWLVAREAIDIHVDPDDISTVRMTLMAEQVQILRPEPRPESE